MSIPPIKKFRTSTQNINTLGVVLMLLSAFGYAVAVLKAGRDFGHPSAHITTLFLIGVVLMLVAAVLDYQDGN